ncbi:putative ABC transport system permease protein [Zobellia uliginosa]|uniref:ABC transport system permease protein n=1 Tax=Zobellia uliginosa TaxID=143224 RepID=A0ABY1KVT7_9FLAO|nr:ABC transporter permease [Zobellia uliginosa]SIS82603.1 putative ABC transport system permease protein [Zobellia uliginosa]
MFDIERWQEIFDTIRKNKLRTFLTGLSVASGIFILVILLGFGQGFRNGIAHEFEQDAATSVWVWPGTTTKKYKGLNPGRNIQLTNANYEFSARLLEDDIQFKSPRIFVRNVSVTYGNEALVYQVQGVSWQFQMIENENMSAGRFLNYQDETGTAKVAVIGKKIADDVFTDVDNPVGEFIKISGLPFKIVGVFNETEDREEERIYIPMTTAQQVFNGGDRLNNLAYTLPPAGNFEEAVARSIKFKNQLQTYLQKAHTVAPDDTNAIFVWSAMEEAKRYYSLTDNIALFFWFVGICTIIAGVVGVSNIMLIVVRERTKEIGIRKALGAKPWSIVGMILHESIFITAISGFAGLIFSMGLLEFLGPHIEVDYIVNPSVNFTVAISTVFVLVLAGAVAGFFPAWRAANIHTIDALRDE